MSLRNNRRFTLICGCIAILVITAAGSVQAASFVTRFRLSTAADGTQTNDDVLFSDISENGRYVVFESEATNLVVGDTNGFADIFVRDRDTDNDGVYDEAGGYTVTRVSVASDGTEANGSSGFDGLGNEPAISADGRYVVFASVASNLVADDTNNARDIFMRDLQTNQTSRVSLGEGNTQIDGSSSVPTLSGNGRYVAFETNEALIAADDNFTNDLYVRDVTNGALARVSVATNGTEGNAASGGGSLSDTGRYVVFISSASNLTTTDTNGSLDAFLHDRDSDNDGIFDEPGAVLTTLLSRAGGGSTGSDQTVDVAISGDGTWAAFRSQATDIVPGDTNSLSDVFVFRVSDGTITRTNLTTNGEQEGPSGNNGETVDISGNGRYVVFDSFASNFFEGDDGLQDVFLRDRDADNDGIFDETGAVTTTLISRSITNIKGDQASSNPVISADGSTVVFASDATNLITETDAFNGYDLYAASVLTDLILNGSFEIAGATEKEAANWSVSLPTGEKRKCKGSIEGECFFSFKGVAGENSKLKQNIAFIDGLIAGDFLIFTAQIKRNAVIAGGSMVVKVKYEDVTLDPTKVSVDVPADTADFSSVSTVSINIAGSVAKLKTQIKYQGVSGKFQVDDVHLYLNPAPDDAVQSLLPLPPVP